MEYNGNVQHTVQIPRRAAWQSNGAVPNDRAFRVGKEMLECEGCSTIRGSVLPHLFIDVVPGRIATDRRQLLPRRVLPPP